jgi:hypothetical protein
MIRLLQSIPGTIHLFRTNPWPHQKTLVTPRDNMSAFLSTLLTAFPVERGVASTDQVVFEPDSVLGLLNSRNIEVENHWCFCIEASETDDVSASLDAMLNDWIDFVFVPSPETFAIYADHDEYLTLYAPSAEELLRLIAELELRRFSFVADYVRPSEGSIWR